MLLNFSKKSLFTALLLTFSAFSFFSCQKDFSYEVTDVRTITPADLRTKVSSSVSGFVINENNLPVSGATVLAGTATGTTDKYGYFQIKNVQLVKNAAFVTVSKTGYFKGIKTFIATANKAAFFRIKLLPKNNAGTINGASGGDVTLSNGLKIGLPANGVVTAATNAPYTGLVTVSAVWIDPKSPELNMIMPGDLRGTNTDGQLKNLTSYGMAAVELTGASGELLQVASGKQASLTMPIPASIAAGAPNSIPLWYFNETNGLWQQEGIAAKSGNSYVGNVKHFSFWNCDVPANYVHFDCTVLDASGQPVPYIRVKISRTDTSTWNSSRDGYTDSSGYVGGLVPDNSNLKLEIFSDYGCSIPVYTQTFTTSNSAISLGNITIPNTNTATVTGTVTDCNGGVVSNGFIIIKSGYQYNYYPTDITGAFSFNTTLCGGTNTIIAIGLNNSTFQESSPATHTLTTGVNAIGNYIACGISTQQFINYTINGATYSYTSPQWLFSNSFNTNTIGIGCYNNGTTQFPVRFDITKLNLGLNSIQNLTFFKAVQITDSAFTYPQTIPVNITEYGAVGTYWGGNFTTTLIGTSGTSYNISCNFRTRRY